MNLPPLLQYVFSEWNSMFQIDLKRDVIFLTIYTSELFYWRSVNRLYKVLELNIWETSITSNKNQQNYFGKLQFPEYCVKLEEIVNIPNNISSSIYIVLNLKLIRPSKLTKGLKLLGQKASFFVEYSFHEFASIKKSAYLYY